MRKTKTLGIILMILCLAYIFGACSQRKNEESPVVLNERQQKLADSIWEHRSLWSGCEQLVLYRVGRTGGSEYYLTADFLVSKSNQGDLFGYGDVVVGTYKKYTYRIVNERVIDDLSLGEDGVLAGAQQLGGISLAGATTNEELKLRINRLASNY